MSGRVFDRWLGKVNSDVPVTPRPVNDNIHPKVEAVLARHRIPADSPEWLTRRLVLLTATNFAILVHDNKEIKGENKYQKIDELFQKKTGQGKPFTKADAMDHGLWFESEAARVYTMVTGIELIGDIGLVTGSDPNDKECIMPDYVAATPDFIAKHFPIIIEIKCPWKKAILHECPLEYYPQVQVQMACTGLRETHLVQYEPPAADTHGSIDIVIIKFDPNWITAALVEAKKFWDRVLKFYSDLGVPVGTQLTPEQATKSVRNKTIYLKRNKENKLERTDQLSSEKSGLKIESFRMSSKVAFGRRFSSAPKPVSTTCSIVEDDDFVSWSNGSMDVEPPLPKLSLTTSFTTEEMGSLSKDASSSSVNPDGASD